MSIFDTFAHLAPHQLRVVAEREELWTRYKKLIEFIHGTIYTTLPVDEQERLCRQSRLQAQLVAVLDERIAAFTR